MAENDVLFFKADDETSVDVCHTEDGGRRTNGGI